MAGQYATSTEVPTERSKAEIERILARYGADQFASGWDQKNAMIGFVFGNRSVRFTLPMPDRASQEIAFTPTGKKRAPKEVEAAFEQAQRQRWRALALVIKAKLEAVETGIVSFDDEFAMHMVLPNGQIVRDVVLPEIEQAYATGHVRPFLAIESAK